MHKKCNKLYVKITLICLMASGVSGSLYSRTQQELFLMACQEYNHKNYAQALELYTLINPVTASVLYNRANVIYKLGNPVEALVWWNRARLQSRGDLYWRIIYAIDHVNRELSIPTMTGVKLLYEYFLRYIFSYSLVFFQIAFIILLLIYFLLRYKKYKIGAVFLLVMLLVFGAILGIMYSERLRQYAIISGDNVSLMTAPDKRLDTHKVLSKGTRVAVYESRNNWSRVRYGTDTGWIMSDLLITI